MARISVFGIGYVGVVSAACLARDGHEVVAVDLDREKVRAINEGRSPIVEKGLDELLAGVVSEGRLRATTDAAEAIAATDASFVCVGTPSAPDGSVGLVFVKGVCESIGKAVAAKGSYHSVIIRSTIVPGTMVNTCIPVLEAASGLKAGEGFGVGYFPEFLRESTAIEDYYDPGLIVYGALDDRTAEVLRSLNDHLPCESHLVDLSTAEMVKYTSNSWRAVKITFANEIGNIAKACGLDGQLVMRMLCSDHKVAMSPAFLRPGFAFGGSCLPKDVRALRALAADKDTPAPLLGAVLEANEMQISRAEQMIEASGMKSVGLVGISFKPGTDDLRESPLADLAARLIDNGKDVRVYDPYVSVAFQNPAAANRGNDVVPDLDMRMADSIDDLIASTEILIVGNSYEEAREPLLSAVGTRPIVDLTRLDRTVRSNGSYQGICW
ncbi:UDP-glucose/GDP-mannose dehydrogenase family protein [Rubellimicrobium rubrum]|uniref:UDP-glucose 6-dehydrogenase n=1 Tax=Rubellimicrobium rubrum TaxID=2585369 RepID=A0A5C4N0R3_9RHOB|nr:nucleotide sugar dehydrogenase [Rubellimicrobium rubrum]TNC50846.1 UDP-glucose/GDP-mannose dehydrogenase family protein [Rubellimicrobium rubrum]